MQRLEYLALIAPDSEALKDCQAKLLETKKQVVHLQTSLAEQIVKQNEVPPDAYQGKDREALIKLIADKWAKDGTKAKILKAGIIGTDWTRKVAWEVQNQTLSKIDRSRIQGYVLVENDKTTVVRHSINLTQDHLTNDVLTASFLNDPKQEVELSDRILKSKLK